MAGYKIKKAVINIELDQLNRALNTLNAETTVMTAAKSSDDELRKLAGVAMSDNKLTRPLVDALIDKVYVYPGNRVEIRWKVSDFVTQ